MKQFNNETVQLNEKLMVFKPKHLSQAKTKQKIK